MNGSVKWFDAKKGFGFIAGADGKDYFVHHSSIDMKGYRSLNENEAVTFEPTTGKKGPAAINVVVLNPAR